MYKSLKVLIFILFSLGQLHAQTLGFKILNNAKKVKIPFEIHNNLIILPVILNNQLPLKFILDTGVRTTILTEKSFSDILNLSYARKYTISGVGNEADTGIEAYITNDVSLTLPGIKGKGHSMFVLEKDYLELRNYLGTEVHGVLGYELFSRFIVKIDYDNKMLMITTPEYFKLQRSYEEIDITIEDTKPYINGVLNYEGKPDLNLKLMIDTGASHGLMLLEQSSNQLFIPEKNIRCNLGRGLAGELHGRIGRVNKFSIGKRSWNDVLVTFPEEASVLDSIKGGSVFRNGSVGGEILSRYKVIFNYSEGKMYLKKGSLFKKDFSYNLSGLSVKAKGSRLNTYEIVEVRPNSNAEIAGVKSGDQILSVNNISTESLNLDLVIGMLNRKAKKTIRLELLRENKKIRVQFKLENQI